MLTVLLSASVVSLCLLLYDSAAKRRAVNRLLTDRDGRLKVFSDLAADWYWETDNEFRFTEMSGAKDRSAITGGSDHIGKHRWDMPYVNIDEAGWRIHRQQLERHETFRDFELVRESVTGERSYYLTSGAARYDSLGRFMGYRGIGRDITARRRAEEQARQLALFDSLTQLPNRAMFVDRLKSEMNSPERLGNKLAILVLDLDRFKEINDAFGHEEGDQLLVKAARRLQLCFSTTDTVARFGGDEFAVLVRELENVNQAHVIAEKVLDSLRQPFEIRGGLGHLSVSIGIAVFPDDSEQAEDLLRAADQSMYVAKSGGRDRFSFFTSELQDLARKRIWMIQAMHEALDKNQFWLAYQPIVDMRTRKIIKAEALIRWCHPDRGFISPAEFIPIAESSGIIKDIGDWVFDNALQQAVRCREICGSEFQISINKSPAQFQNLRSHRLGWAGKLRSKGLPGGCIVAEITEGLLLDTNEAVALKFRDFFDSGIQVALDDFGTGFSSLSYLQKYHIDYIKIDQSFVKRLSPLSKDLALCQAIVVMAHKLGIRVIAEGVETQEQSTLLQEAGCDLGQGYLYARPMPREEFEAWLLQYVTDPERAGLHN